MAEATPRFFADETDLALARALAAARPDVVYPGHPKLPEVPRQTLDPVWLPIICKRRLVVISRDKHIRRRPVEKAAWRQNGVRGFVLTGKTSQSTWDSLRIIARHWDDIEALISGRPLGPWMISVTGGMREIDLGRSRPVHRSYRRPNPRAVCKSGGPGLNHECLTASWTRNGTSLASSTPSSLAVTSIRLLAR
jgi:hypothetical protein